VADPVVVVSVSEREGREYVEHEVAVQSLQELYEACRRAAPGRLSRVLLRGPEGEIRLHFGSLLVE
jgi:hypothetical protein